MTIVPSATTTTTAFVFDYPCPVSNHRTYIRTERTCVSVWSLLNAAENKVRRRKGRAANIVALPSDGSGYESRRDREQEFKSSTSGRRK